MDYILVKGCSSVRVHIELDARLRRRLDVITFAGSVAEIRIEYKYFLS